MNPMQSGPLLKVMTVMVAGGGGGGGSTARHAPYPTKKPTYGNKPVSFSAPAPKKPKVSGGGSGGRTSSRPRSSGGGGGGVSYSGGGSGGSSLGSSATGRVTPVAPKPPSLADYLGTDSAYMQQKSALDKAMKDYKAQQGQSQTQYLTGYTGDLDTLGKNRKSSLGDLENDYAGRGLLQSGLYADSMSDMNTDFDKRQTTLEQAKAAFLAQLGSDLTNFTSEQGLTLTRAQQEAAARRAAKYGV